MTSANTLSRDIVVSFCDADDVSAVTGRRFRLSSVSAATIDGASSSTTPLKKSATSAAVTVPMTRLPDASVTSLSSRVTIADARTA